MKMSNANGRKRPGPPDEQLESEPKVHRRNHYQRSPMQNGSAGGPSYSQNNATQDGDFRQELNRRNQMQEAEQMREWVAQEDEFVLKQSKKKAKIRVKEGRAKLIDWLAVTLSAIDETPDLLEDDGKEDNVEVMDPSAVFDGLDQSQLKGLETDIDTYLTLESRRKHREYWKALKVICKHYIAQTDSVAIHRRTHTSVLAEIDRLLKSKSLTELSGLEKQVTRKLESDEPIDVEYWEQLKRSIEVYVAKAELKTIYQSVIDSRLAIYQREQQIEASNLNDKLASILVGSSSAFKSNGSQRVYLSEQILNDPSLDPEPELKIRPEDKNLETVSEKDFLDRHAHERQRVLNLRYVPPKQAIADIKPTTAGQTSLDVRNKAMEQSATTARDDFSSATNALYEREVARGVQEDEEIFAGEEEVTTKAKPQWEGKYRPRKPRYFNRVQMGYEWNKYNQTHYDHDNPPPKVVQGYKFNVFYPDLIDKARAPTYRIEREGGRKRGESFAPAGEEDTCLIRFISGPPYEDIAFRIVDKEWDFSAKRERGFRSSFDKGILQLHFQFKKVYYRK